MQKTTKRFSRSAACTLRIAFAAFCLLTGFSLPVRAQMYMNPYKSLSQFNIDYWDADKGFPSVAVTKVLQTRDSYIWMATFDGLVRFDGASFTLFNNSSTQAFTINDVSALMQDRKGELWIGTNGGGLLRYDKGNFLRNGSKLLQNETIYSLYEDNKGILWVGTRNGIFLIGNGKVERLQLKNFNKIIANSIFQDREGKMWIGTQKNGIIVINGEEVHSYSSVDGLSEERITTIYQDRINKIWVGTETGLFTFKDGKFVPFSLGTTITADTKINAIYEDVQSTLWFATQDGLCRLHKGVISTLTIQHGIPDNNIQSVCVDQEGSLWVGTYRSGLMRLREGKFSNFTPGQGLVHEAVNAATEDSKGNLWIATDRGLSRYSKGKFTNFSQKDGLPSLLIRDVAEDRNGNIWLATYGGLTRFDGSQMTSWTKKEGLSDNQTRRLFIDSKNNLWIGTKGGLNMMTPDGRFVTYTTVEGLSSDYVMAIAESKEKGLIVGTNGGGINIIKDDIVKVVNSQQGLAGDIVFHIYEDKDNIIWIGTNGGLTRIERNNYAQVTEKQGLISDKIFQVAEDQSGYLWMSSNKGIFKVKKDELNQASIGRIPRVNSIAYNRSDGLLTNDIPANGKLCNTRDGRFVLPTLKGISIVNPDSMLTNSLSPPVYIEQILVDHQGFIPDQENVLSISQQARRIDINYTALSFLAPEKVRFKYKLEPFDKDWIEAGTERKARFTNLAPGLYTFRVIACNNDGVWNNTGAYVHLRVEAWFYQQEWVKYVGAILVFFLIAIPMFYMGFYQRGRKEAGKN